MSLQHFGKGALRIAKNYTKGYSDVQAKVRDATSNDPWGPTGTQMNEIAQMTYNQNDFVEIMEMLDKRLNDKGKNWRHVFKALTLLDYLLHSGSENVVIYFRDNLYIIKTLKEFQYVDEYQKDVGANVRQKAKDITNLLSDEQRLREERRTRAGMRDRMVRGNGEDEEEATPVRRSKQQNSGHPERRNKEDDELQRAIEASKRSLAEEQAKLGAMTAEERDLQAALKMSEEEEAKRKKSLEDANQRSLFDDQTQLAAPSNNPFPLVDTGAFGQNQLQPQYTQMLAPQFTSFNPYAQQVAQEQMQQQYLLQQQEWMRQQQEMQNQQAMQAQAQAQAQQDEWNRQQQYLMLQQQQQQLQPAQPLYPQQTAFGSNNPFAIVSSPASQSPPVASTSSTTSTLDSFSLPSTFATHSPSPHLTAGPSSSVATSPAPSSSPALQRPQRSDGEHAHLANLLAGREDGLDTFGNVGQLRYGHTNAGRIVAQKTGHNPFATQQQQNEQPFFTI